MNMKKYSRLILLVLIVVMGGTGIYFYNKATTLKADPNAASIREAEDIVARAGKLIMLPKGETPTVANINDPEKLRDQAFFAKAKVGDKALFYQSAARAYLYDPVANKILAVAIISFGTGAQPSKVPVKKTTAK